jgi:PAS domain S-box-containing protein
LYKERALIEPEEPAPKRVSVDTDADMFRLLVSSVRDYAIFMLDPAGNVLTWNEGAARIKGYTEAEIVGTHFSAFYAEEDVRAGKPDWELVVAADSGRFEDEGWRVRKDGTTFWANVVITALRDSKGELRGFGKVTRDLTIRRQAELDRLDYERTQSESARQQAVRLAELEAVKTEFLNVASHELRGPLAIARGYMSMLSDGTMTPEQFAEMAPLIESQLLQIEILVQKMLETARLEYGQLALARRDVNVTELARDAIENIELRISSSHRLVSDFPQDVPIIVVGDPERLRSAVLNLLDNAVKYSPDGGTIHIKVASRRGRAFVSVADEGVGIGAEGLARIFERFVRLEHPATMNVAGTGLGLCLAREVARHHGGDILVESSPGRGSRFTLSIPLNAAGGIVSGGRPAEVGGGRLREGGSLGPSSPAT